MHQVTLQPATLADLPLILQFITEAQQHLKDQGIDQWQDGYPNEDGIREDIAKQIGYLACLHSNTDCAKACGEKIGYLCIDFGGEPAYDALTGGQWNTNEPYAVIHRMTIGDAYKGNGLANNLFAQVDAFCQTKGMFHIRIDTHPDNTKMQHVITKSGFALCGTVLYASGLRLAYDKCTSMER